ncbi:uncharacterized protein LOC128241692 [Mya arenaria]|uniref:uncharacterized protein LOC128241692 n=1 Tax=Mya arenaria TaxID=6604 RepID=UPI0022DF7AAC|nr:uncharacterized protein LOC128241692 [Mya arenaria]XP_052814688.1 uncharacterized protein LOC128241692 [Mya arenaria]XP_052814689.1 uncharacterized protein LOC128241692 [Mya arenaria]XP_052814690.1 uncharacterized protein LOC128241692 [Mya arenaria]XP_052814691.1 uncharacterized protein LOC128241692 [Mya arenaria]XP_052814692.1 uncharacterized protein LOC128241692 [Mya arenaria]
MASKHIQCEMCCDESAVGYCKICGYVGETCVDIHKTVKVFQKHTIIIHVAVKMHEDDTENLNVQLRDITEERCKQHQTEKAMFLCNIHDSMICGRCLHSDHIPCAKEVVDLLHEVVNIDCEKVNTMKFVLKEVRDEILFLKDEAEHCKESSNENSDKCMQECIELGNKIKRRVDELTSGIREKISEKHNENLKMQSHITKTCDEKTKWCDHKERKIDNFVANNMAGYLYLMSRHFENEISDARSHLKEIKHKHSFKGFDFKENKVILKCLFEDLEEVCEQQDEVTGSDDGSANDVVASTAKINKTRRELNVLLNQIKQDLDKSEQDRKTLCDELQRVKQDIDNSETKRKGLEQELLKAKRSIEEAKKETATLRAHIKENCKWTQPTGKVAVKDYPYNITLAFTFPDGIQTTRHPSPRNPIKGGTFTGLLFPNSEGKLLCRMLKEAFRRGVMFICGMEGKVVLDGVSLYDGPLEIYTVVLPSGYVNYIRALKSELSAKGITEADIDQTEELYETLTVDGPRFLEASPLHS